MVATKIFALVELEHVLATLEAGGGRMLAEAELDPVGGQGYAEGVPERLRLAREHVVHSLDERDGSADAP